ncbi:Structural maintenance of chromosomes protein 1A [Hondaea fermentalgiana]|uniref:Structural maintenance of chromosomes protein 1A n=1 Tax=Hondaea fermentalgiana TaxID=2315210 RepID=A0A2R5GJS8_9STRA|nr:Structural maintenance of chromosomes protein 1A [Hondaea fermentalgiana]|eukprot:GBG31140.1 Structural maintenance of chromosomes protein 1A [Hondaea fermentalgiana]
MMEASADFEDLSDFSDSGHSTEADFALTPLAGRTHTRKNVRRHRTQTARKAPLSPESNASQNNYEDDEFDTDDEKKVDHDYDHDNNLKHIKTRNRDEYDHRLCLDDLHDGVLRREDLDLKVRVDTRRNAAQPGTHETGFSRANQKASSRKTKTSGACAANNNQSADGNDFDNDTLATCKGISNEFDEDDEETEEDHKVPEVSLESVVQTQGANGVVEHLAQLPIARARDVAQDALALLSGNGLSLISVDVERCLDVLLPLIDLGDSRIAAQLCALAQALGYCDENKTRLVEANLGKLVATFLSDAIDHPHQEHLIVDALDLLASLASAPAGRSRLGEDGIVATTARALEAQRAHPRAALAACKVLQALALEDANKNLMMDHGAIAAMVKALEQDTCAAALIAAVCTALYFVTFEIEGLVDEGNEDALLKQLTRALCTAIAKPGLDEGARARGLAVLAAMVSAAPASAPNGLRIEAVRAGATSVACAALVDLEHDAEALADAVQLLHSIMDQEDLAQAPDLERKSAATLRGVLKAKTVEWEPTDSIRVCAELALERMEAFLDSNERKKKTASPPLPTAPAPIMAATSPQAISPSPHAMLAKTKIDAHTLDHVNRDLIDQMTTRASERARAEDLRKSLKTSCNEGESLRGELMRMHLALDKAHQDLEEFRSGATSDLAAREEEVCERQQELVSWEGRLEDQEKALKARERAAAEGASDELKETLAAMERATHAKLDDQAQDFEARIRTLEEKVHEREEELKASALRIESLQRDVVETDARSKAHDDLQDSFQELKEQMADQERQNDDLQRLNESFRSQIEDLRREKQNLQREKETAQRLQDEVNEALQQKSEDLQLEKEDLKREMKSLQEDLERENAKLLRDNEDLKRQNNELSRAATESKAHVASLENQMQQLEETQAQRLGSVVDGPHEIEELRRALGKERNERAQLEGELASLRFDKEHADGTFAELEQAIQRVQNLEREVEVARTSLAQSRAESQALRDEIVNMEARTHTRELDAQSSAQRFDNLSREYEDVCALVQEQEEMIQDLKRDREDAVGRDGLEAMQAEVERLKRTLEDERRAAARDQTHRTEIIKAQLETEYRMVIKALTASRSRLEERLERSESERLQLMGQVGRLSSGSMGPVGSFSSNAKTSSPVPSPLRQQRKSERPSTAVSTPKTRGRASGPHTWRPSSAGSLGNPARAEVGVAQPWKKIFAALRPDAGAPPAISFTSMYNFVRKAGVLPHRFTRGNCDVIFASFADQSRRRGRLDARAFVEVLEHLAAPHGAELFLSHETFCHYVKTQLEVSLQEVVPAAESPNEDSCERGEEDSEASETEEGVREGERPQTAPAEHLLSKVWRRERKPLGEIFSQYARRERDPRAQQRSSLDQRTMVHQLREVMDWDALVQMCSDFDVMPSLVGRGQLRETYQEVLAESSIEGLLDVTAWLCVLERVAMLKFPPRGGGDHVADGPAVSMLQWMDASNGKIKLHNRRRSGTVVRKFNVSSYALQGGPAS